MENFCLDIYRNMKKKIKLYLFKDLPSFVFEGRNGVKYNCSPNSALDTVIIQNGIAHDWICNSEDELLKSSSTIFDIGANAGHVGIALSSRYCRNGGIVYAFEPDPENFKRLTENIKLNPFLKIHAKPIALQDDHKLDFSPFNIRRAVDNDKNMNFGLSSLVDISLHKRSKINVKTSTIDNEVKKLGIKKIDFIKIDVEGAENLVLRGGIETIRRDHPIIQYEYSNVIDRMTNCTNTIDCYNLLKAEGYVQYVIRDESHLEILPSPDQKMKDANILCFYLAHDQKKSI